MNSSCSPPGLAALTLPLLLSFLAPPSKAWAQDLPPIPLETPADQPAAVYARQRALTVRALERVKAAGRSAMDALRDIERERDCLPSDAAREERAALFVAVAIMRETAAQLSADAADWLDAAENHRLAYLSDLHYRRGAALKHLRDLGWSLAKAGQFGAALDRLTLAIQEAKRLQQPADIVAGAYLRGSLHAQREEHIEALQDYERARKALPPSSDGRMMGRVLDAQGVSFLALGRLAAALEALKSAIRVWGAADDPPAPFLDHLGQTYLKVGDPEQAEKVLKQARMAATLSGEAERLQSMPSILNSLGQAYTALLDYPNAKECFQTALALPETTQNKRGEGTLRANLGVTLFRSGEMDRGVAELERSLKLRREVGDQYGEGASLHQLAQMHSTPLPEAPFDLEKAEDYERQALRLFSELGNVEGRAVGFNDLMVYVQGRNARLTSLYGKIGANLQQERRRTASTLDRYQLKSFSERANVTLLLLAQNLLAQNRKAEAIQAIDRARQEEYLNDNPDAAQALIRAVQPLAYAPKETRWVEQEAAAARHLTALHARSLAPGPGQAAARRELEQARAAYVHLHQQMEADYAPPDTYDPALWTLPRTPEADTLKRALVKIGKGTCALYFLVANDRLFRILVTPDRTIVRIAGVRRRRVEELVEAFRANLIDPRREPRPDGKALYDVLFRELETMIAAAGRHLPVMDDALERELQRTGCRTLLIAADGPLRSIPFAALSPDGRTYLAQRYAIAYFTPGSSARLEQPSTPVAERRVLAAAVTRRFPGFPELVASREEANSLVRSGGNDALFPGKKLVDGQFTRAALLAELKHGTRNGRYVVVHFSTHFQLEGTEGASRLLLGDGSFWTLEQIKGSPPALFGGVELITLSACDTATIRTSTGERELENFAVLAQRKGATAVLGSLWPVNSVSTLRLMHRFYAAWRSGVGKAAALQQAQLRQLGVPIVPSGRSSPATASFVPDAPTAHPFYWAGFLLIGNTR